MTTTGAPAVAAGAAASGGAVDAGGAGAAPDAGDARREADARLTRVFGSRRASLTFSAIVFAATAVQVLTNPVMSFITGSGAWDHPWPIEAVALLALVVVAAQAAALLFSAPRPRAAVALSLACYLALVVVGVPTWLTGMQLVVAIALFLLAAQAPLREAAGWAAVAAVLVVAAIVGWGLAAGAPAGMFAMFAVSQGVAFVAPAAGATALGIWWGVRSRRVARAQQAAAAAEHEHEARVDRARAAERGRIAQELHDVAGQHLAGLLALADAALDIDVRDVDQALRLIDDMRAEGRFASVSLYGALRDLRAVDAPQVARTPDLRDAADLYAYWRKRGAVIDAHPTPGAGLDVDELPPVVSTSAYRGLQEALTNAAKHAPGARVQVGIRIHRDDDADAERLLLTIRNGPGAAEGRAQPPVGLGWGLDGLRERLDLLHGTVEAGPTAEGGWQVRMCIPVSLLDAASVTGGGRPGDAASGGDRP